MRLILVDKSKKTMDGKLAKNRTEYRVEKSTFDPITGAETKEELNIDLDELDRRKAKLQAELATVNELKDKISNRTFDEIRDETKEIN